MNDQPPEEQKKRKKANNVNGPCFVSMKHCEGVTGIPRSIMQQASEAGCGAIDDHSRVYVWPLTRWYFAQEKKGPTARERKEEAEAAALERENRIADGQYIDVEKAAQIYGDKIESAFQKWDSIAPMLDKQLAEESNPVSIRRILTEAIEEVKKIARSN